MCRCRPAHLSKVVGLETVSTSLPLSWAVRRPSIVRASPAVTEAVKDAFSLSVSLLNWETVVWILAILNCRLELLREAACVAVVRARAGGQHAGAL